MIRGILISGSFVGLFFISNFALAHGGSSPEPIKEKPKFKAKRQTAKSLGAIETHDIDEILEDGRLPEDVVTIHCKLSESIDCRGLDIKLEDGDGHEVARSHSGTHGLVAFEGLDHHKSYVAKIESEKYFGEVTVEGGSNRTLHGDRKSQ